MLKVTFIMEGLDFGDYKITDVVVLRDDKELKASDYAMKSLDKLGTLNYLIQEKINEVTRIFLSEKG